MNPADFEILRDLVRDGQVHRSVYLDPAIFELEMERIFGRAWVYVGHESQIPNPGDFFTTHIGRRPVIVCRDRDTGTVHVLFNRCGHRGAIVCNNAAGNVRRFRCGYHGWVFETDGRLSSVPMKDPYYGRVDLKSPAFGLARLPRVASYKGFIFASCAQEGARLEDHLAPLGRSIDQLTLRSPLGELEVRGGVQKYTFRGNWKLQVENIIDGYHPSFSHASTLDSEGRQFRRRGEDTEGPKISEGKTDEPSAAVSGMWVEAFPQGHSVCSALPDRGARGGRIYQEYLARMKAAYGAARTEEILAADWHNTLYYPNVSIQLLAQHIRVIKPIRVDCTEVWVYPVFLKGVPDEMNHDVIRYLNITHSSASLIQTDDLEQFTRIQRGLHADGADWVSFERGIGADQPIERGGFRADGSSELAMRTQYRAWKNYMFGEQ